MLKKDIFSFKFVLNSQKMNTNASDNILILVLILC